MPKPLIRVGRIKKEHLLPGGKAPVPDHTAVRVALWRALHLLVDEPPHVFCDEIGLKIADPRPEWRKRPDMDPSVRNRARASIVARARFTEDLVLEKISERVEQSVILGAGLDTFVQRHPEAAGSVRVYEIDKRGAQVWKKKRLAALGLEVPEWQKFVPVDFESGASWRDALVAAGFSIKKPAVVSSMGVSMYLTEDSVKKTLREAAHFASGTTLVMSYMLPLDLIDEEERPGRQMTERFARLAGTPFLSFFDFRAISEMARSAGFKTTERVSSRSLTEKYFSGRKDGLKPSSAEEILIARR